MFEITVPFLWILSLFSVPKKDVPVFSLFFLSLQINTTETNYLESSVAE